MRSRTLWERVKRWYYSPPPNFPPPSRPSKTVLYSPQRQSRNNRKDKS